MINFSFTLLYTSESLPAELDKLISGYDHPTSIPIGDFSPEAIKDKLPGIFILESGLANKDDVKKIIKAVSSEHTLIILLKHDDLPENAIKNFPGNNQYIIDYPLKGKELDLTLELAKLSYDKSQLVKKSELLSEAVNQSANSIIITNPKGEVEFVNHNFEEKTGYTQEEVVGKNIRLIKASEQDKETYRLMWETVTKGEKWKGEFCNRKKNGELFWDESTITPILDNQGNIIHYLAINNDVTARKNAEAELERGRQLLKQIIDRVPQYIFVRDSQGRYHLANKAFAEYCGKKPEEIVGQKEIDINPNVDYAREILEEDAFVIESGTNILREEKFFDQNLGKERYFQYSKVPFTLPDTGKDSVLSVWTDVTEQKETEQELREAREKLLDAQKLASFGNWSYDIENKVANWSEQVYEQYGLPSDKPAPFGDDFYSIVHPEDKQLILDTMEKAREGGFAKYECRAIKPDKSITYIEATVKPLYKDGVLTGFFGTSLDITTRKKFEDELVLARKEAIAASKAKSDFLSVMSHEIRTPLNAIIVMAEMLINEVEDPTHKENLEILNYSAKDLLRIVNDILDYSKIEAGKLDLESIDVNIRDFASKIIKTNQLKADEKGIRLELDFDESIPETIKGDPLRLGQILRNLISNSIKFTEKGGVKLSVKLRGIDKESCRLYFGVKDTGIGIRPEKVDALFEVFTQASSETSRKFGGTGLGLAIVKNLLIIHNSQIYVESEPEKGSLFYFEIDFPYLKTVETKTEVLEEGSQTKSLKGYNIMLVEDNVMNIMVAKKIFKKWDCNINVAEDGYIALQKATRIDFDLIVMDLQMPGIDGFETTRKLRKLSEHYNQIPIIALTAAAPSEVKDKVLEAGMNEMVTKPFKTNLLYETIKAHLPEKSQNLIKSENIIRPADADLDYNKVSIEVLVKLRTFLHRPNQNEAIKYIENVARSRAASELESEGLVEIIETINSIIRINRSYINNKNLLVKEMITDLKKAIDDLKLKYE
jgi:PAS domain S-box-containing protein